MNRYFATLIPSSLLLPDPRSSNLSGQGPSNPVNGQSSTTIPKVVGSMPFDPIKVCWVHQFGDALEGDPFAAIDELETLDGEG